MSLTHFLPLVLTMSGFWTLQPGRQRVGLVPDEDPLRRGDHVIVEIPAEVS